MRWSVRTGWILVLLAPSVASVWAQQSSGSFTGIVTDTLGAVVPQVSLTATEVETGLTRAATSGADGSYELPLLPPGHYRISAEKQGFKKATQGIIELRVDAHVKVDLQLQPGEVTTVVNVEGSAAVLDTQTATVGTTIEQSKISELPYNGRSFLQSDTSIAVGTYSATPPLDSIQEFKMETGVYDAKFGVTGGAQINMVTKSGTNQFHGTLYEYLRNNKLDARNFFEPEVPPFHRNQYGASVGGPLSIPGVYNGHDRTFYFLNFEGLRDHHAFFSRAHLPTLAERGGDFSDLLDPSCTHATLLLDPLVLFDPTAPLTIPNNNLNTIAPALPAGTLDPVGQALEQVYPRPNIPNAPCGGENYTTQVRQIVDTNSYVGRFDHRWGSNDSLLYRHGFGALPIGASHGRPGLRHPPG